MALDARCNLARYLAFVNINEEQAADYLWYAIVDAEKLGFDSIENGSSLPFYFNDSDLLQRHFSKGRGDAEWELVMADRGT